MSVVLRAAGLVAVLSALFACEPYETRAAREAAAGLYVDRAHYLEGYGAGLQDSGAAPRPAGGAK